MSKWLVVAVASLVVIGVGRYVWSEARREDTPERYAQLCGLILAGLPAESAAPPPRATSAERAVWFQDLQNELGGLARECRQLAPIANDVARELAQVEQVAKRAQPVSKLILSGVEILVGVGLKSSDMLESGSKGALQQITGYSEIWEAMKASRERIEIARVRLAELAPTFCGPTANEALIEATFTEEAPALLDRVLGDSQSTDAIQTLRLKNRSGQTLSRCVIKVRLVRPSGESFLNLYYVHAWPDDERRLIRYAPRGPFADTHRDVNRVLISVAAKEKTSPEISLSRTGETWPYTK